MSGWGGCGLEPVAVNPARDWGAQVLVRSVVPRQLDSLPAASGFRVFANAPAARRLVGVLARSALH